MSSLTAQQIRAAAKTRVNESNLNSVFVALDRYGYMFGLDRLHRQVQYLAQLMHESGDFRYDREVWGPTPAQKRYDTRTDLGNTPEADGDGKKYMGRTAMQLTGKDNYVAFHEWCEEKGLNPPDFVVNPDLVNTDPWEGLVPIWYWDDRHLNRWADQGDVETISTKINGGKNGLADRIEHLVRLSLVALSLAPGALKQFQASKGLEADGDPGPKTRAALHQALLDAEGLSKTAGFVSAPVVEEKAVVPTAVEGEVKKKFSLLGWAGSAFGGGGGLGIAALTGFDYRALIVIIAAILIVAIGGLVARHYLIAAIRDIRQAVEQR